VSLPIHSVRAGTIVVPDDYPTIQEAINHASEGDTVFVRSGTYYGQVIVNKTVSLIGENRHTVVLDGSSLGVETLTITAGNVGVSELQITDGYFSAIVIHGGNTTISNCIITINGIYIDSARGS